MAESCTDAQWQERYEAMYRLKNRIFQHGLDITRRIRRKLKLHACIADSGNAVIITPTGEIGLCDHYSDSEFVGHIDSDGFDQAAVENWRERSDEIPECADCFAYPECASLKKCPVTSTCFRQYREDKLRKTREAMLQEYHRWQQNKPHEACGGKVLC